jgi:hypothetical protein
VKGYPNADLATASRQHELLTCSAWIAKSNRRRHAATSKRSSPPPSVLRRLRRRASGRVNSEIGTPFLAGARSGIRTNPHKTHSRNVLEQDAFRVSRIMLSSWFQALSPGEGRPFHSKMPSLPLVGGGRSVMRPSALMAAANCSNIARFRSCEFSAASETTRLSVRFWPIRPSEPEGPKRDHRRCHNPRSGRWALPRPC